jgi:hypothetical protein
MVCVWCRQGRWGCEGDEQGVRLGGVGYPVPASIPAHLPQGAMPPHRPRLRSNPSLIVLDSHWRSRADRAPEIMRPPSL